MAESLLIYREGERFGTVGRAGRHRVWEVDLTGEPVDVEVSRPPRSPLVVEPDPGRGRRVTDQLPAVVDTERLVEDLGVLRNVLSITGQEPAAMHRDEVVERARSLASRLRALAVQVTTLGCSAHQPRQHRDGRPPWCETCGRTADGVPHQEAGGVAAARERG